jgi:DNA-binding transcriptional regulator YhcF (GntR family)
MIIRIDVNSPVPAYRQIADAIRVHLVDGSLRAGDRLPTVRQLSLDLALHFNTVAEAYRTLAEEGWLDLTRGRGTIVLKRPMPSTNPLMSKSYKLRVRQLIAEVRAAGIAPAKIARELRRIADCLEDFT